MGVGAAAIMPTTLSILTNIFPEDERPKAIAIWAAVAGMGIAIGPISGGWLIEHFAWSSIFLVNLPVVAGVPDRRRGPDPRVARPGVAAPRPPGIGLSIAGLTAIVWGLIEAPERGWTSPTILGAFAAGAASSALFVAWELRAKQPMLDVTRVPQPALQRGERLDHVRVLRADGRHVLPHHLPAVGAGLQRAPGRRSDGADRGRPDPRLEALGALDRAVRTKVVVAGGLPSSAFALGAFTAVDVDTEYYWRSPVR